MTIRHRGYYDDTVAENSLQGFRETFAQCLPGLETDVQLTKDRQLVLFHDNHIGRMLEANFDPEARTGPNPAVADLTLAELRANTLLTTAGTRSNQVVPTLDELIQTAIDTNGPSLMFLDLKSKDTVAPVLDRLKYFSTLHPDAHLEKRIVLKLHTEWFPRYSDWISVVDGAGLSYHPMANPVMTPLAAAQINTGSYVDYPDKEYTTNAARSWALWSEAPREEVPLVEVLLKDSQDFKHTTAKSSLMGSYNAPTSLEEGNGVEGTMAEMITIAHARGKTLGLFSPVPDYVAWRHGPVAGYTVPNVKTDRPAIDVQHAFSNADGSCCYQLKDLLSNRPEAHEAADLRSNLDWAYDAGVRVFTSDDTDSIDTHFHSRGLLESEARPVTHTAPEGMHSALAAAIEGATPLDYSDVKLKAWNGGSSPTWQGQVCIWSNENNGAWAIACNYTSSGYTATLRITTSPTVPGAMRIQDTRNFQCLTAGKPGQTAVTWTDLCDDRRAQWFRTKDNQYKDYRGTYLTLSWQNLYSQGKPYAWLFTSNTPSGSWSAWNFRR
ncbi:glycerophosphodiester phosphodiesterase [Corynebacterium choanae]|nr:glycerophosphodiester phosphodiesterase family protein [Corynebacterium choanae]